MLGVNSRDELTAARLLDFFGWNTRWNRALWDIGTILSLKEVLEASEAVRDGVLSQAALDWLMKRVEVAVGRDCGAGDKPQHQLLQSCLRSSLRCGGFEWNVLQQAIGFVETDYLSRWAGALRQGVTVKPERAARYIAAHLLDAGFSADYLHRWWKYRVRHETGTRDLADIIDEAHSLIAAPPKTWQVLVPFAVFPGGANSAPQWRDAQTVAAWLAKEDPRSGAIRQVGGWEAAIPARDPAAAVVQAAELVERIAARVTIGTRRHVLPVGSAWVKGERRRRALRVPRRVEILSLEREGQLFVQTPPTKFDAAIELLGTLDEGAAGPAVASGWAAIEALLSAPGEEDVAAADRLAALVACSFPRAELTTLAYAHEKAANDAVAQTIRAAVSNRDKASIVAQVLLGGQPPAWNDPSDRAASDRMLNVLQRPQEVLRDVQAHAIGAFRRLYRQRNLVLHGGRTNAIALVPALRAAAPLVGAGVDRIAHAHLVGKIDPLALGARAQVHLSLLGTSAARGPLDLLE